MHFEHGTGVVWAWFGLGAVLGTAQGGQGWEWGGVVMGWYLH